MIESKDCWMRDICPRSSSCPSPFCIKLFKINELSDQALLTQKQRQHIELLVDADGTDRQAFATLKSIEGVADRFVERGKNLYIHSRNVGNSKTSWALRILNSYIAKIWASSNMECKALFVHVPRFLLALKDNISNTNEYAEHINKNILNADLVVFDEIGTKTLTTFEAEHILNIVNARVDQNKSNIYTSNLSPEELQSCVGDRLYSRIVNYSIDIELFGQDKRGLAGNGTLGGLQ